MLKYKAIVKLFTKQQLCQKLNDISLVSVIPDASNRKAITPNRITALFFYPVHGIKVKLLEIHP